jgi:hypothetical protein
MITEAIWEDKKWTKGSSRPDIRKFIVQNYDVDESKLKENMSVNLNKMLDVDSKTGHACLKKVEDNYKLNPDWRKEWKKHAGIRPQKRKKKKDPDAPKHPRNSYLWYLTDVRETLKEKYPDKDHREITLMVADDWKHLPAKKKKKYENKAADDKERYEREKEKYERKKEKKRRDTSEESSSESRSKGKKKRRRYDSEDSSAKSDRTKSKRRKKGSDSESSGEKKKRRKEDDSSEGEKKPDSSIKKEDDKKK